MKSRGTCPEIRSHPKRVINIGTTAQTEKSLTNSHHLHSMESEGKLLTRCCKKAIYLSSLFHLENFSRLAMTDERTLLTVEVLVTFTRSLISLSLSGAMRG